MSKDSNFLDSLLEDLENVVSISKDSEQNKSSSSLKYVPHPPPDIPSMMNPKIKFAIVPNPTFNSSYSSSSLSSASSSSLSSNYNNSIYDSRNQQKPQNNSNNNNNNNQLFDPSLDNLLDMLNSPEKDKKQLSSSEKNYQNSSFVNNSTPSRSTTSSSQFNISSSSLTSTPVSSTPNNQKSNSNYNYNSNNSYSNSTYSSTSQSTTPLNNKSNNLNNYSSNSFSNNNSNNNNNNNTLDTSFDDILNGFDKPSEPITYSSRSNSGKGNSFTSLSSTSNSSNNSSSGNVLLNTSQSNDGGNKTRCSRVVIAGTSLSRGVKSSAFSKCVCDRLRCLQCNFEVLQFRDKQWDSSVEYMFFRNNVPNVEKLSIKLLDQNGSVAYCCQCTWKSIENEVTLTPGMGNQPQWMCSGH